MLRLFLIKFVLLTSSLGLFFSLAFFFFWVFDRSLDTWYEESQRLKDTNLGAHIYNSIDGIEFSYMCIFVLVWGNEFLWVVVCSGIICGIVNFMAQVFNDSLGGKLTGIWLEYLITIQFKKKKSYQEKFKTIYFV